MRTKYKHMSLDLQQHLFHSLNNRINDVKHLVKWAKVTLGRKALHMRYMLRMFRFIVKSQSASSQSKTVPWCTNLQTGEDVNVKHKKSHYIKCNYFKIKLRGEI